LFLEQGYDHFSVRKVAERIGYSPTTIMHFRQGSIWTKCP